MTFTPFERDVLNWYLDHVEDAGFRQQVQSAQPALREYSGAGLFLRFAFPCDVPVVGPSIVWGVDGPHVESPLLELGAGATIFVESGRIDFLEVFAYGSFFPDSPFEYVLHDEAPPAQPGGRRARS